MVSAWVEKFRGRTTTEVTFAVPRVCGPTPASEFSHTARPAHASAPFGLTPFGFAPFGLTPPCVPNNVDLASVERVRISCLMHTCIDSGPAFTHSPFSRHHNTNARFASHTHRFSSASSRGTSTCCRVFVSRFSRRRARRLGRSRTGW